MQTAFLNTTSVVVQRTYQLLLLSLMVTGVGIFLGMENIAFVKSWFWGLVIGEFVAIFALIYTREKEGINTIMLFLYAFLSGLTISVVFYKFVGAGKADLLYQAMLMTILSFFALTYYAVKSGKDFKSIGGILLISLIVLIIGGLLNIFFFHNPVFQLLLASAGVIVFSAFMLYDTQHIMAGNYTPVEGAISLHLNLMNMFLDILQILNFFDDD